MTKDSLIFLEHIIECIEKIEKFINNVEKEDFLKNEEKQSAIIRQIEIIGEAVRNLPLEFVNKYPLIEWSEIIGMRNKLSHGYFEVDLNIVWDTIEKEIPKLKKDIKEVINKEKSKKKHLTN